MILRYPGGKSRGSLHNMILDHIKDKVHGVFAEPFFGGGGITIGLLKKSLLKNVIICEKDDALRDLWQKVIYDPRKLLRPLKKFTPSVDEFVSRKRKILKGTGNGFDALVVNRLAHGGRGAKAGPQGGFDQSGKYKIDCRWNPTALEKGIQKLNELFSSVEVALHNDYKVEADYYYVDPPYWEVGDQMYIHNFSREDHYALNSWLSGRQFLLSYNNHPEILKLYSGYNILIASTSGNGGNKKDKELLIW